MTIYKAEDLKPGMIVRSSRGIVTIVRRLKDRTTPKGIVIVRFECHGKQKTYSTEAGQIQVVIAVPLKIKEQQ